MSHKEQYFLRASITRDVPNRADIHIEVPGGLEGQALQDYVKQAAIDALEDPDGELYWEEDLSSSKGLAVRAQGVVTRMEPSMSGLDVFEMLKAAERETVIPPEVFMYAAARKTQEAGEDFAPEFIEDLLIKAQTASEAAVYKQMVDSTPLRHDMMVLNGLGLVDIWCESSEYKLMVYKAGSVLRGCSSDAFEYSVYRERQDTNNVVLACLKPDDNLSPRGVNNPDWRNDNTKMHIIDTDFNETGTGLTAEDFCQVFEILAKPEAEAVLVKHFGYKSSPADDTSMSPSRSAGMDHP